METEKPRILYKYHKINDNLEKLIENSTFWFEGRKLTNQTNDLFDLSFSITDRFREELRKFYQYGILKNDTDIILKHIDNHINNLDIHGICCFTENYNSDYMWTHYATNEGLCLGFDTLNLYKEIKKVDYSNEDIVIDNYKEIVKAIFTKKKCFSEEREWRLINQKPRSTEMFDKKALVEIIFGNKVNQQTIECVVKKFKDNEYGNIKVSKVSTIGRSMALMPLFSF